MVWAIYHSGGEGPPRIDLVCEGAVSLQINLNDLTPAAIPVIAGDNLRARLKDERFVQDVELRKRIDGIKQPMKGGFYYEAKVECPFLDKTNAALVLNIINHCATGGNYYVHFYPHLDNTALYFVALIVGDLKPFEKGDRAYYFGHTADLQVCGLEPLPRVPFTEMTPLRVWQNGAGYAPGDIVNMAVWENGAVYGAAEKATKLGYVLKKNNVYNFAD